MPNPLIALKAIRELGLPQVGLNALYKLGLKTGYFRALDKRQKHQENLSPLRFLFDFPTREALLATLQPDGLNQLTAEADEIVSGKFRQFASDPVEIQLTPPSPLYHWTAYETDHSLATNHQSPIPDIKLIWEPARFGWAFTLGRAYHVTGDERYPAAFWRYFEQFSAANPPGMGPNWMSGQEVGIRLMGWVWAAQAFSASPHSTPARLAALAVSTAAHAARIPATLLYARSQNNNHLLTEAAALYTAALALPGHLAAAQWHKLGHRWLAWCFANQIDKNGEYVQHSMNYHRLMLQTALWVKSLNPGNEPASARLQPLAFDFSHLDAATRWMMSLIDPFSGRAANLGPNDGAYIFPLTICPFDDYRPMLQAAWLAFSAKRPFESGPWDELALWFGLLQPENEPDFRLKFAQFLPEQRRLVYMRQVPVTSAIASPAGQSWAYLRSTHFTSRPGHADLLHLDLWWRGLNIARDAGTYHYNAAPPWDNALTHAAHHNTITLDGADQFTRAGRFLYLDWRKIKSSYNLMSSDRWNLFQGILASHNAYEARFGATHRRQVHVDRSETWIIHDEVSFISWNDRSVCLHWLLPDWDWQLKTQNQLVELKLHSPYGWITLKIEPGDFENYPITSLVRAGEVLWGEVANPATRGWVSPTYGMKIPALSLAVEVKTRKLVEFTSQFILPTPNDDQARLAALADKLETLAASLSSVANPNDLPMPPDEILPLLTQTAQKIRRGEIEALEAYRYNIDVVEWRTALGAEGEKLLESIDADLWHFRLY